MRKRHTTKSFESSWVPEQLHYSYRTFTTDLQTSVNLKVCDLRTKLSTAISPVGGKHLAFGLNHFGKMCTNICNQTQKEIQISEIFLDVKVHQRKKWRSVTWSWKRSLPILIVWVIEAKSGPWRKQWNSESRVTAIVKKETSTVERTSRGEPRSTTKCGGMIPAIRIMTTKSMWTVTLVSWPLSLGDYICTSAWHFNIIFCFFLKFSMGVYHTNNLRPYEG